MSEDFRDEFEDDRPFWMLPTIDHDLRKRSKVEEPTVRKYTINPRLSIEKTKFIELVQNITLQSVIDNLVFPSPESEIRWKGAILKRDSPENVVARAIHSSMQIVISSGIDYMVGKEEERKRQDNIKKLGKKYKKVSLDTTPKMS